jgi:hypothetical protein
LLIALARVVHATGLYNSAALLLVFWVDNRVKALVANGFDMAAVQGLVKGSMSSIRVVTDV